jgi:hypothetical protein
MYYNYNTRNTKYNTRRRNNYRQNQTKKSYRCDKKLLKDSNDYKDNFNLDFDLLRQKKVPDNIYSEIEKISKAYKKSSCDNYTSLKSNNKNHNKKYEECKTITNKRDNEKIKVVPKLSSHFKKIVMDKTEKLKNINSLFTFSSYGESDHLDLACAIKLMLDTFNMQSCRRNSSTIMRIENLVEEFGKEVSKTKPYWVESAKNILKLIYYNEPDSIQTIKKILKFDKDLIIMLYEFLKNIPVCQS